MKITIEQADNGYIVTRYDAHPPYGIDAGWFGVLVYKTLGEVTQILPDLFEPENNMIGEING